MFPVSDFNFVVCGIATFAATVGYACSRKMSTGSYIGGNGQSNPPKSEAPKSESSEKSLESLASPSNDTLKVSRKESLKRKAPDDGFDEPEVKNLGYPHNLANIYPYKRSKTPPKEVDQPTSMDIEIPFVSQDPKELDSSSHIQTPPVEAILDQAAPTKATTSRTSTPPASLPIVAPIASPSKPISSPSAFSIQRPQSPAKGTRGFAAFAGTTSAFASTSSTTKQALPSTPPVWQNTPSGAGDTLAQPNAIAKADEKHAISAIVTVAKPTPTHITGEENEVVELELKGVKLYVKRGKKAFSDGMHGHIKLLSDKTTLDERLLFRREPLWKVSMNVRVNPTLRCTYDADEHVLRLILKEPVEDPTVQPADWAKEVVIYALKPGRSCSKQDFKEFAETLMASKQFKPAP